MSRWERTPLPATLADDGLEEIPTVLMSRTSGGSEVLFEDLRERYRRAMDTPELTSPSLRATDAAFDLDEIEGHELLDHPTGDIDPLNDYLELHSLRTGVHSRIDDRSDPMSNGVSSWPQDPIPNLNRVDTPPPQAFSRAPDATLPEHAPGVPLAPAKAPPQQTPAPPLSAQGPQPHLTPASDPGRVESPAAPNRTIPIERAYRQVYGRTIRPNPNAEHGSTSGMLYRKAMYTPSSDSELDLEPIRGPNPHRWDAWILAGFAISGIWALALVRVLL